MLKNEFANRQSEFNRLEANRQSELNRLEEVIQIQKFTLAELDEKLRKAGEKGHSLD